MENKLKKKRKSRKKSKKWEYIIKPNFLSHTQCKHFLSVIDDPRDMVFFMILMVSGRRVSEVLMLKVEDFDFENNGISFNILKKRVDMKKFTPMDNHTMQHISNYIKARDMKGWQKMFKFSRVSAWRKCRKYAKKANLSYVGGRTLHPHTFRHTFVREQMVINNNNMKLVADLVDHSSTRVTELYLNYTSAEMRNARVKLSALIHNKSE